MNVDGDDDDDDDDGLLSASFDERLLVTGAFVSVFSRFFMTFKQFLLRYSLHKLFFSGPLRDLEN